MLTFDVRIYEIEVRQGRPKPYRVRWRVGTKKHSKSYAVKAQADGRRSQLLEARRKGEQFDTDLGLPSSELREQNTVTWFQHSVDYAQMKWPHSSAKHRAGIADALATVTSVWVTTRWRKPIKALRLALYSWAFRMVRNPDAEAEQKFLPRMAVEDPPREIAEALAWIQKNSLPLTDVARSETVRKGLEAISTKLDGGRAAENTTKRKKTVLSNAFLYAMERERLEADPLRRVDWTPPSTDDEVDFRYVPNQHQAKALITGVRDQGERGEHLEAFFGCIYYAAMRPGEVAALRKSDCTLPEGDDEWGELLLSESRPEVARGWTDEGTPYEKRGLKRRARTATRSVPIPPILVRLLRDHIKRYGTAPDGRLFRAARGGRVRSTEYCDLWKAAREEALTPHEFESPLAETPYANRHAGISLLILAGVEPPEVARRAGHSLAVLYHVYAKILRGRESYANDLISAALQEPEPLPEGGALQSPC